MLLIASKSQAELQELAWAFAKGEIFTGLHLLAYPQHQDGRMLKEIFCPLQFLTPADWSEYRRQQCVPYQWVKKSIGKVGGQFPIFHEMELLTFKDALYLKNAATVLYKDMKTKPAPVSATVAPATPAAPAAKAPARPENWLQTIASYLFIVWLVFCVSNWSITKGNQQFAALLMLIWNLLLSVIQEVAHAIKPA
jgi:hypothetical protein